MASERKQLGLLNVLEGRVEELLSLGENLMSGFDPVKIGRASCRERV